MVDFNSRSLNPTLGENIVFAGTTYVSKSRAETAPETVASTETPWRKDQKVPSK